MSVGYSNRVFACMQFTPICVYGNIIIAVNIRCGAHVDVRLSVLLWMLMCVVAYTRAHCLLRLLMPLVFCSRNAIDDPQWPAMHEPHPTRVTTATRLTVVAFSENGCVIGMPCTPSSSRSRSCRVTCAFVGARAVEAQLAYTLVERCAASLRLVVDVRAGSASRSVSGTRVVLIRSRRASCIGYGVKMH